MKDQNKMNTEIKNPNLTSLWMQEHPRAQVPNEITSHPGLDDVSWHNDAMPSFAVKGSGPDDLGQIDIRLWVDYADKELSEADDQYVRFCVSRNDWDSNDYSDLYRGDDAVAAINVLSAAVAKEKVVLLFNAAIKAAEQDDSPSTTDLICDTQNAAFEAAEKAGWNWEQDEDWNNFAIKATSLEIAVEGKVRFIEHFTLRMEADLAPEIEMTDAIAAEFVNRLQQYLSPDEMQKASSRNAAEPNKSICHTHDFCDANEAMAEAFTFVVGHEPDTGEEADCVIWNDAWSKAKVLFQVQYPPNNEATMQAVVENLRDGLGYPATYEYPGYISIMGLAFGIDDKGWTGNTEPSEFRGGDCEGLDMGVRLDASASTDKVVVAILLTLSRHLNVVAHRIAGPVGH